MQLAISFALGRSLGIGLVSPDDELTKAVGEVRTALGKVDVTAIRRCAMPQLKISNYARAYREYFTSDPAKLFPGLIVFGDRGGVYLAKTDLVELTKALTKNALYELKSVSRLLAESARNPYEWEVSEHLASRQIRSLVGPGAEIRLASNAELRLSFQMEHGSYRLCEISVVAH
ncbi:MAG: hypothetical protein ACHQ50_10280 [Fimbriimonadales bacterium]